MKSILLLIVVASLTSSAKVSSTNKECVPPCRTGFYCNDGACIERCNPPCPKGYTCNDSGECIKGATTTLVDEPLPKVDLSAQYTRIKAGQMSHFIASPLTYGSTALTIIWLGLYEYKDREIENDDINPERLVPYFSTIGGMGLLLNQVGTASSIISARKALNNASSSLADKQAFQEIRGYYIRGQLFAIVARACVTGATPLGFNTNFGTSIPLYSLALISMVFRDVNWYKMNKNATNLLKDRETGNNRVHFFFGTTPTEWNELQWSLGLGVDL